MLEVLTPLDWLLLSVLGLATLTLLYYYFGVFGKLAFYKPQTTETTQMEPVSIVIAARNEFENLQKYLIPILEQDYPQFEVVVVNDCSWDSSQAYLEELQKSYPHLRVSQLIEQEKYPTGKKFALTIGIKAARYDLLLLTDADCEPASNQWLKKMQSRFVPGKEIVLGFSPYYKRKGLLNFFIRFETLVTAQFYFSLALMKNAFMGVGRNLAYRKDVFFRHKGFAGHQHIICGDDDLFINEAATPSNVAIEIDPASFMYTEPKTTYRSYSAQKIRHMHTGKYYRKKHQLILGTYYTAMLVFYAATAAALSVNLLTWPVVTGIFVLKLICQSTIVYLCGKKLRCQNIAFGVLLLDLVYLFFLFYYGTRGFFNRKLKRW